MKGTTTIRELDDMPFRYTHAIYRQYHLFTKSQEAQQSAAAEDMMEELEDGVPGGGSAANHKKMTVREQQMLEIKNNLKKNMIESQDVKDLTEEEIIHHRKYGVE